MTKIHSCPLISHFLLPLQEQKWTCNCWAHSRASLAAWYGHVTLYTLQQDWSRNDMCQHLSHVSLSFPLSLPCWPDCRRTASSWNRQLSQRKPYARENRATGRRSLTPQACGAARVGPVLLT